MTARQLMDTVTLSSAPLAASPLTVTLVKSRDELEAVTPHWLALLERGAIGQNVHNDPRMISITLRQNPEVVPHVLLLWRGDDIVCVAPFYVQPTDFSFEFSVWRLRLHPSRALRPFGESAVLAHDVDPDRCVVAIGDYLRRDPASYDYVVVYGMIRSEVFWRA